MKEVFITVTWIGILSGGELGIGRAVNVTPVPDAKVCRARFTTNIVKRELTDQVVALQHTGRSIPERQMVRLGGRSVRLASTCEYFRIPTQRLSVSNSLPTQDLKLLAGPSQPVARPRPA